MGMHYGAYGINVREKYFFLVEFLSKIKHKFWCIFYIYYFFKEYLNFVCFDIRWKNWSFFL